MVDMIQLELRIIALTPAAYLVNDGDVEAWIPISQIEVEEGDIEIGSNYWIDVPEWLALEKGFI